MNQYTPKSCFEQNIADFQQQYKAEKKRYNRIATLRLLVLLGGITLSIWLLNSHSGWWALITIAATLGGFMALVKVHDRVRKSRQLLSELILINQEESQRLNDEWQDFDPGREYLDPDHPYIGDLDIFGQGSLFQYLNRSATEEGREKLAKWLSQPADERTIALRQEAVEELCKSPEWRQHFQATGRLHQKDTPDQKALEQWLNQAPVCYGHSILNVTLYALPALTLLAGIYSLITFQWSVLGVFVVAQWIITGFYKRTINEHHLAITHYSNHLKQYQALLGTIESQNWNTAYLNQLSQKIKAKENQTASGTLHQFIKILDAFDTRLGMIVPLLLNGLLLWDIHCVRRIEQWKSRHREDVLQWFPVIGEWDALHSLAGFFELNPEFAMPQLSQDSLLKAKGLSHPLLPRETRVSNDVEINEEGQFLLITGSNMAGKSTFLRTTGVNLVLAMTGAPVCAEQFTFKPMTLYTSMRIGDSLRGGQSTFYAELARLRSILEALENADQPVFILLDEILKGTNSQDKLQGSRAYIEQLIRLKGSGLIATHDIALSELENAYSSNIFNYNFEVMMEEGDFQYDYKLKRGVCQTMNASELMRSMGIGVQS